MDPDRWKAFISRKNNDWARDGWYDDELALVEVLLLLEVDQGINLECARELLRLSLDLPVGELGELDLVHWPFAREAYRWLRANLEHEVRRIHRETMDEYGPRSLGYVDPNRDETAERDAEVHRAYLTALLARYETLQPDVMPGHKDGDDIAPFSGLSGNFVDEHGNVRRGILFPTTGQEG
jgi:hypothetical protein